MSNEAEADLRAAYHAAANTTFEKTLRADDAWGSPQSVTVRWRPLAVEGVDAGLDNIGRPPLVWSGADDAPVCLRIDPGTNMLRLIRDLRQVVGDTVEVVRPEQVPASRRRLEPGEFQIVERTDEIHGCEHDDDPQVQGDVQVTVLRPGLAVVTRRGSNNEVGEVRRIKRGKWEAWSPYQLSQLPDRGWTNEGPKDAPPVKSFRTRAEAVAHLATRPLG